MESKYENEEPIEFDVKKFLPLKTSPEIKKESEKIPEKMSVLLIFILSLITLGIYTNIWYRNRSQELNNLKTEKIIKKGLTTFALIIKVALIFIILTGPSTISPETMGPFYEDPTDEQVYIFFMFMILLMLDIFFTLLLAFYSRTVINHAIENKNINKKISGILTFVFGHLYLQYEINRIINDTEDKPIKAPWIFLGILLITITIAISLSI